MNGLSLAKYLMIAGFVIILIGVLIFVFTKMGIPLGKLPGDIHLKKEKLFIYFPIVTSILVSVFLTLLINFILWIFKK